MTTFNAGAIEANLTMDRSSWSRDYRTTLQEVERLENASINIPIDADTTEWVASLANVQRQIRDMENASPSISIDADAAAANTTLTNFQRRLRRLDGRRVNVTVDVDRSRMDGFSDALSNLTGNDGGGGRMGFLRIAMYAIIGLSPLLSSAIVGVIGTVIAFSGAIASAGGAVGVLAAGIIGTIARFKKLKEEGGPLPAIYQKLSDSIDNIKDAWGKFIGEIDNSAIGLMTDGMDTLSRILPDLTPIFENASTAVRGLIGEFGDWIGGPDYTEMLDFFGRLGPDMITSFGHIFGNLAVFFGQLLDAFEPVIRNMMGGLEEITGGWADWARGLEENKGFQDFLADIQTYGPMVLGVITSLWNALRNIGEALEPFAAPMAAGLIWLFDAIANMDTDLLTLLIAGFVGLWAALGPGATILGAIMAVSGELILVIALVVAAIVAIAVAVQQAWDKHGMFYDAVMDIWNGIRDTIGPIINDIKKYFTEHTEVVDQAKITWRAFRRMITNVLMGVRDFVERILIVIKAFWKAHGEDVMRITSNFITGALKIIQGVFRIIKGVFQVFGALMRGDWKGMWEGIKTITRGAGQVVGTLWRGLLTVLRGIWNLITGAARSAWNSLKTIVSTIVDNTVTAIKNKWDGMITWFGGIGGRIATAARGMWNSITSTLGGIISDAKTMINGLGFDINVPDKFPGPSSYHIGTSFAEGGVVTRPTLALIGEGGEDEIVTPERKMREIVQAYSGGTEIDYGKMAEATAESLTRALVANPPSYDRKDAYVKIDAGQEPSRVVRQMVDGLSFELRRLGFGGKANV